MTALRAVIYVRQSTHREESVSLEQQETSAREHCARYGYAVVDVIRDEGISGLKWDKRPGVQQVLKRVQNGDAERVIVWRWSRLSRKQLHQHQAIDVIERSGALVESSTEPFDTKTAGGTFGRDVMLASAAFESKQKGEQWKEAHSRRRSAGLPAHGLPAFGYDRIRDERGERYEVNPFEAKIVRWLYQEYISGTGIPKLVKELDRRGVVNKRARQWKPCGLTAYLEGGFAAGLLVSNRGGYQDENGQRVKRTPFRELVFVDGAHEPIIDEATWKQYKAARIRREYKGPRTINPTHLLAGLVRCADCGGPMARRRNNGTKQFACLRRNELGQGRACNIQEWRLLECVQEWLREVADEVSETARNADAANAEQLDSRADAEQARKEVAELDQQLVNLTKQLAAGRVPESVYDATRTDLLAERSAAEERRTLAEAATETATAEPPHEIAAGLLTQWDRLSVPSRRKLLGSLVTCVWVTPGGGNRAPATPRVVPAWEEMPTPQA